jgi:hypothetical protein
MILASKNDPALHCIEFLEDSILSDTMCLAEISTLKIFNPGTIPT